jgi:methionyl-tRNA formyltransferase
LRLVLFANHHLTTSIRLAEATLHAVESAAGIEVVAIVDGARDRPGRARLPRQLALRAGRRLSDPLRRAPFTEVPLFLTLPALARRHHLPLLAPREKTVNDAEFVEQLAAELQPDAALVLMVDQVFRRPLLAACREAVNYHNAALPAYRGMGAREWEIYRGGGSAGFTFHRMIEGLDAGPILVQGSLEVPDTASCDEVERAKTARAAAEIGGVLEAIVRREPGVEQRGEEGMFTAKETEAMREVGDGSDLTKDELERRLRAFEVLKLTIGGQRLAVTALRPAGHGPTFVTADGERLEASRVMRLTPTLFRLYRAAGLTPVA